MEMIPLGQFFYISDDDSVDASSFIVALFKRRKIKNATTNGTITKVNPKQQEPRPVASVMVRSVLNCAPGIKVMTEVMPPSSATNKPGHPQKKQVARVAKTITVLLSMAQLLNE
jgi:hypothetical protein